MECGAGKEGEEAAWRDGRDGLAGARREPSTSLHHLGDSRKEAHLDRPSLPMHCAVSSDKTLEEGPKAERGSDLPQ